MINARSLGLFALLLVGTCASASLISASEPLPAASPGVVDSAFTLSPLWDDGKAEFALYRLEVEWTLESGPLRQLLRPLALLVKHPIHPQTLRKWNPGDLGKPVSALNWQILYDVSNSRVSRRLSVRQSDLRPLRQTHATVSWEANCLRDWRFPLDQPAAYEILCSGDESKTMPLDLPANGFTAVEVPLLVRSLDLSGTSPRVVQVLGGEGTAIRTEIRLLARETLEIGGRTVEAEKIEVRYAEAPPLPGAILAAVAPVEVYWRGLEPHRPLLRLEGRAPGFVEYRMELIESFRSAWWEEDVLERLRKFGEVPGVRP